MESYYLSHSLIAVLPSCETSHPILRVINRGLATFHFLLCPMLSNLLRALAELIDSLPERTLLTVLLALVPLGLAYLYRRFLHIPFAERAVKIVWIAPEEAT